MTLTFPDNPTVGQTATTGGRTFQWNGKAWDLVGSGLVIPDAPSDSKIYGRRNAGWVDMTADANLQLRRGTAAEVAAITPLEGEPVWATDEKALFVGDGATAGGVPAGQFPLVGTRPGITGPSFSQSLARSAIWISKSADAATVIYPPGLNGGFNPHVLGDARGPGAVDFKSLRTSAADVASGENSFLGPDGKSASGLSSVSFRGNASGSYAVAFGGSASADFAVSFSGVADGPAKVAFSAAQQYDASSGRGQAVLFGLRRVTTSATPTTLRRTGSDQSSFDGYPIPTDVALFGVAEIVAIRRSSGAIADATNASPIAIASTSHGLVTGDQVTITGVGGNTAANATFTVTVTSPSAFTLDGSTGNAAYTSGGTWRLNGGSVAAHYLRKFAISNLGGVTSLIGTVSTLGTDYESDAGLDVLLTANDTSNCLEITVTGLASRQLRWVAIVRGVEQGL